MLVATMLVIAMKTAKGQVLTSSLFGSSGYTLDATTNLPEVDAGTATHVILESGSNTWTMDGTRRAICLRITM